MTTCTRCQGTGFLNLEQIPGIATIDGGHVAGILAWIAAQTEPHDVVICDCCGNGGAWYGTPGEHYSEKDQPGNNGPYAYNGGLCECD